MSKKLFSNVEVVNLSKNINISKVSNKSITYSYEFRKRFICEYKIGKSPRLIFEEAGFNINILGIRRVEMASYRWRKSFNNNGGLGLADGRKTGLGRPIKRPLTDAKKIKRLEIKVEFLKMENDFLKKLEEIKKGELLG